jgi:hypothetical protein
MGSYTVGRVTNQPLGMDTASSPTPMIMKYTQEIGITTSMREMAVLTISNRNN